MLKVIGAAAVSAALTAAGFLASGDEARPSTPDRTIWSAVYASNHANQSRFCSYLAQSYRNEFCGKSEGPGRVYVIVGSKVENKDGSVTYLVADRLAPPGFETKVTVAKQPNGKWRITEID